jgi:hypothetical protein
MGKQESSYIAYIRGGYSSRRKSRYRGSGSNIKIRDIYHIPPSSIYYYIYKETNHFIADNNIKNNIRKFIIKLRKKNSKIIIRNKLISKRKRKNKSNKKAHGFISTNYSELSTNKNLSYIDSSGNTEPEITIITKEQKIRYPVSIYPDN